MDGVFRADFAGLAKVRLIRDPEGNRWMIPVVDIAAAIDYDRQTLHDLINRETEAFEGFVSITLTNPGPAGGRPDPVAVSEEGVYTSRPQLAPVCA